jgi:hypothetical protein
MEFRMNLIVQRIMTAATALSVSALIAACGARSTNRSNETFIVYEDAPKTSLSLTSVSREIARATCIISSPHSDRARGQVTGEVSGSKILIKLATEANPDLEKRGTLMFFTFGG